MYKLIFGKTFREDVKSSVNYIRQTLQAPVAAGRLKEGNTKVTDTKFISSSLRAPLYNELWE